MNRFRIPKDGFVIKNTTFGLAKSYPEMLVFGLFLRNTDEDFWAYQSAFVNDFSDLIQLCDFVTDTLYIAGVREIYQLKGKTVWLDDNGKMGFQKEGPRVSLSVSRHEINL